MISSMTSANYHAVRRKSHFNVASVAAFPGRVTQPTDLNHKESLQNDSVGDHVRKTDSSAKSMHHKQLFINLA